MTVDEGAGAARRMLQRIAWELDVPMEELTSAGASGRCGANARLRTLTAATEMVRLFARVENPQARRSCLAFVRAAIGGSGDADS